MNEQEHAGPTLGTLAVVYVSLLALLAVTVGAAYLHLGGWSLLIAMAIALLKAALVLLWFMHLRYETGLVKVFAAAGVAWLALLLCLTMADYLTRAAVL